MYVLESSGLQDRLERVYITTTGQYWKDIKFYNKKFEHLEHFNEPRGEIHTHKKIFDYCSSHKGDKVLFFYNRGSSMNTDDVINRNIRRALDCFVLNPHCIEALNDYDTCGWRFTPLPFLHYTGGYWWATCKHINSLIDPYSYLNNQSFIIKTSEINSFRKHKHDHNFHGNKFLGTGHSFGKAWLGSKAMFNPSDCLRADTDNTFIGGVTLPWNPVVKNCPNFNQNFDFLVKQATSAADATTTGTMISRIEYGEKCDLAALLLTPDRFIDLLQEKKKLYKTFRTEKQYNLINQRTIIWYGQSARLYNEILEDLNLKEEEVLPILSIESSSFQKVVAFWHITTKTHHYNDIMNDQILMLQSSGLLDQLDSIYYCTVGRKGMNLKLTDIHNKIKHAFHFGSTGIGDELLTLHKVHEYCRNNQNDKILYFHNKGNDRQDLMDYNFRKSVECYTLNPHCIEALDYYDTCGWRLSPLPYVHYPGNFWWATCKHINKLIDPLAPINNQTFIEETYQLYQKKQRNDGASASAIDAAIISIKASDVKSNIDSRSRVTSYHDRKLGLGKFFSNTWLGSLPIFNPADCMDANADIKYIGGLNLPWLICTEMCPNLNNKYYHLFNFTTPLLQVLKILQTNVNPQNLKQLLIPKINYGSKCNQSSTIITHPKQFQLNPVVIETLSSHEGKMHLTLYNQRSILWYGQNALLFNNFLKEIQNSSSSASSDNNNNNKNKNNKQS